MDLTSSGWTSLLYSNVLKDFASKRINSKTNVGTCTQWEVAPYCVRVTVSDL